MAVNKRVGFALLVLIVAAGAARAQSSEERTVEAATDVLREIMAIPAKAIPASLLADAQGVAIVPGMVKGGFIVGIRQGKGVIITRNADNQWVAPAFITITGGSIGLQAGLQATDVIAVFRTRQSIDRLMRGKLTVGADLAVAAGPVGREALAATDTTLKAEILSYSRSRGLFAGLAIDGTSMQVDHLATAAYYRPAPGLPQGAVPASAVRLVEQVVAAAEPKKRLVVNVKEVPVLPPPATDAEGIRTQLAESMLRLQHILDPQWKEYLALPAELYTVGQSVSKEAISRCLDRYGAVASDARYQNLTSRAEFRETHALLTRYRSALDGGPSTALLLPPPPK